MQSCGHICGLPVESDFLHKQTEEKKNNSPQKQDDFFLAAQ